MRGGAGLEDYVGIVMTVKICFGKFLVNQVLLLSRISPYILDKETRRLDKGTQFSKSFAKKVMISVQNKDILIQYPTSAHNKNNIHIQDTYPRYLIYYIL